MARKSGLGKGLDILIPQSAMKNDNSEKKTERERKQNTDSNSDEKSAADFEVKISLVEPNKEQPRKNFEEDALNELADSIKQHGIIQPLVVVKKDEHFEIVTGERRWRAAKIAGLKTVPVVVKNLTEQQIMELSLIENLQREDLNPIEEAMAYQKLMQEFNMTQEELSRRVSKSRTVIANTVRLLKLDEGVKELLSKGEISNGHARSLLALENLDEQYDIAMRIVEERLSVRETEELVRQMKEPHIPDEEKKKEIDPLEEKIRLVYRNYEDILKRVMGTKVSIKKKKDDKGKIEIEYYSMDELERLLELLQKLPGDME